MGRFTDSSTFAEKPGAIAISKKMLKTACPDMFSLFGIKQKYRITYAQMSEYLLLGDSQPAIVHSLSPFLVAAYSDEMDAVVMVRFDEKLVKKYGIKNGQRMISVNIYTSGKNLGAGFSEDITVGPGYLNRWIGFIPHIVDLFSTDTETIERHKKSIAEEEWLYVKRLASEYAKGNPGVFRDGSKGVARVSTSEELGSTST